MLTAAGLTAGVRGADSAGRATATSATIFDRARIDGIHPENLSIGNRTPNLSASQGAVAELHLDQEGVYPFVTHDFTNAAKGAVGLLRTEHAEGTMSH